MRLCWALCETGVGCRPLLGREAYLPVLSWGGGHYGPFLGEGGNCGFLAATGVVSGDGRREHPTEAWTAPSTAIMFCQVGFCVDRSGFVTLRSTVLGRHPDLRDSPVLHFLTASSFFLTSIQMPKLTWIFQI